MIIFLDTEFTSFEEPYLISIGLVAGENELYFELGGVSYEICAPFVQVNVLPLLTGPVLKPMEGAERLAAFLSLCGPEVTFFCDAPRYDITLLTPFLPSGLHWDFAVPSFEDAACEVFSNLLVRKRLQAVFVDIMLLMMQEPWQQHGQ